MSYQHIDPRLLFGADLLKVFGPKAARRPVSSLTHAEREAILKKVPEYVDTDDISDRPSFFQITNKILTILQQTGALMGIDLDWCDDLAQGQLVRHDSAYTDVAICYKNNSVQRGIWMRHLVEDILMSFNPTSVLSGLARRLSDGTVNLNNGQHRTVGCIILGVRRIPIEWQVSDLISVDVDQYATDNINTLASSEFDILRIRTWRNKVRKAEGRTDLEPEDIICEQLWDIHASKQSRFVEKKTLNPRPLECTGSGNMLKYFKQYGADLYTRALDINCTVWSKSAISTGNCWGLMEFLKIQQDQKGLFDPMFDFTVQKCIQARYSNQGRSGMHLDAKKVINMHPIASELKIPEETIIAAGIYKICSTIEPDLDLAPIMHKGDNISDKYLGGYKVMSPISSAQKAVIVSQLEVQSNG